MSQMLWWVTFIMKTCARAIKRQVFYLIAPLLFVALNNFMALRFCHQTVTVLFVREYFTSNRWLAR